MSRRESNPDQLSLTLQGQRAIGQAVETAREFGKAQRLADEELARLCIVVEELVANLYDHGGVKEEEKVELALACEANGIRVTTIDPGTPFDPWSVARAAGSVERSGGAGLSLIQAWAELVSYLPSADGNRLEILVPFRREVRD